MGSPNSELGHESGENQHKVTLTKDFYISKYPITRLQYWTIIGNIDEISLLEKNAPITSQTVENYKKIITRLNELTLQTRPKGYSFSFPTEAQWEYACRAGTSSTLYNGKNLSDNNLSDIAWYSGNTQNYQKRIGLKQPNFWGLYDMLGNVWEVCNDFYDDLPTQDCTDPQGPAKGDNIVCRGGSFSDSMEKCRSASRHFIHYYRSAYNIGFRVALIKE